MYIDPEDIYRGICTTVVTWMGAKKKKGKGKMLDIYQQVDR